MQTFAHHLVLAAVLTSTSAAIAQAPPAILTIPAFCGYAYPDANAMQRDHKHGTVERCDGELVFYVELTSVGPLAIGIERLADAPEESLEVDFRMVEAGGVTARTVLAPAITSNATCIVRGFHATQPGTWQIRIKASDGGALQKLAGLQLSDQAAVGAGRSCCGGSSGLRFLRAPTAVEKDDCWQRSRIRIRFSGCCGRSGFLAKCRSWRPRVHRLVMVGLARDGVS